MFFLPGDKVQVVPGGLFGPGLPSDGIVTSAVGTTPLGSTIYRVGFGPTVAPTDVGENYLVLVLAEAYGAAAPAPVRTVRPLPLDDPYWHGHNMAGYIVQCVCATPFHVPHQFYRLTGVFSASPAQNDCEVEDASRALSVGDSKFFRCWGPPTPFPGAVVPPDMAALIQALQTPQLAPPPLVQVPAAQAAAIKQQFNASIGGVGPLWRMPIVPDETFVNVYIAPPAAPKCTCGAAKCNSQIHSSWCDLA
jgi:hypothetical protein